MRFSDIDLLGHVNNVRYLDYVQEATTNLMLDCFREAAVEGHVDLVIARTEIDYLGQMNLRPEPYDVWTRVADVGTTSVAFEAEIRDGDRVMARCRTVEVSLDEDDRPRPLIPEHRAVFETSDEPPRSGSDDRAERAEPSQPAMSGDPDGGRLHVERRGGRGHVEPDHVDAGHHLTLALGQV